MENNVIDTDRIDNCFKGELVLNSPLNLYTTYKLAGKVLGVAYPINDRELIKLITYLKKENIKFKVLGNGSNVIFVNNYYGGILIKLDKFNNLSIKKNKIIVGAGYGLTKLALKVSRMGLSGMEFATGIPGSIGGAVYMNAGAYNEDMAGIVESVLVLTNDYKIKKITNKELSFGYRKSLLQENKNIICLEATLNLKEENKSLIMDVVNTRKIRRLETQPLEYPSAGSVFRNPSNDYAGRLIESANLKGMRIGDAKISEKHSNFIINVGNASGNDIKTLIVKAQDEVYKKYNIMLKIEQEFIE